MGSSYYTQGETKIRPGVYKRRSADGGFAVVSARNGIGVIALKADWGPLNEAIAFSGTNAADEIVSTFGNGGGIPSALAFLNAGLNTIYIYRVGEGGAPASVELQTGVTVSAKYPGTRELSLTVRDSLRNSGSKELLVIEGDTVRQTVTFTSQASEMKTALDEAGSEYITVTVSTDGAVENVSQKALTGGEDPVVENESYAAAFNDTETTAYNVITIDTHENDVKGLLANYVERADSIGKHVIAVIGDNTGVAFDTRCANAKAYNRENIAYVGGGYTNSDGEQVGAAAGDTRPIAAVAGYIAACDSTGSIVHQSVKGAVNIYEKLNDSQYNQAIQSGLIMFSKSSDGIVWIDSGVNTLTSPSTDQDDGWKKIKRVKIRYELYDRLDRTLEPLSGQVNGTSDGCGIITQAGQKVIDEMVKEQKLISGTFSLNSSTPDSAWYDVSVVDPDTLEKIYLHYHFRYSQDTSEE